MEIGYTLTSSTKQQGERWTMDYNLTRISFDRGKNESRGSNLLSCTGRRPNTALSLSLSLSLILIFPSSHTDPTSSGEVKTTEGGERETRSLCMH